VPGSLNNVRAFTSDGTSIWVGGGWSTWNGVAQQNLTKLTADQPSVPPVKVVPTAQPAGSVPGVKVTFPASSDRDNLLLTYTIFKNGSTTPLATLQRESGFWDRPAISYVDLTVPVGGSASYTVSVSDGVTTVASKRTARVTVPAPPTTYRDAVLADQPRVYWRMDDAAGARSAADATGFGTAAVVTGGVGFRQTGPLTTTPNGAALFGGSGSLGSAVPLSPLSSFSEELWFSTTSTTGGKLVGFGSAQGATSSSYDKHVYLSGSGQLYFGVYTGVPVTVSTTGAYNDGAWHHVVATQDASGMSLYVDGVLQASDPTTTSEGYTGYFRVGGDNLNGWPGQPATPYVTALIDDVALYTTPLVAAQVQAHYALR
jgi:Concanavalin A-like lectin/glucanases superfamily